jgi:NTE family protein
MENVAHVSSVSGGTLVTGLVFALNGWSWPTSQQFLNSVRGRLLTVLTNKNILRNAIFRMLLPSNWRYLLSRANVLSQAIEHVWGIDVCLSDLPNNPVWSINGTTAETGRRFRFKLDRCGDYELGYAEAGRFKLADAMAVSAALPGAIGPLAIVTADYKWRKRPHWNAPPDTEAATTVPYSRLHIYDGGLYDNLALEPLMDPGTQQLKGDINYLVCSDAGAALKRVAPGPSWSPFRALRILDIALDQARALRVRPLANFLEKNLSCGAYAQIGASPVQRLHQFAKLNPRKAKELLQRSWLTDTEIRIAAEHKTTLSPLNALQFERLERHGYESIQWNELLFSANHAS